MEGVELEANQDGRMFIVSEWVVAEAIDDTTKMLVEISVRADCCGSGWWCGGDAGED